MRRLSRPVGRRLGIGLAAAAALLASGCAAGQDAMTAGEKPTLDGINASAGQLKLSAISIDAPVTPSYPAGADATMRLVIVNNGRKTDALTSISSPSFSGWAAFKSQSDVAAAGLGAGASSSSAAPAGGTSSSSVPGAETSVPVGPNQSVSFGTPDAKGALLLLHAKSPVYPGTNVTVTFSFRDAGTVKVVVPVALQRVSSAAVVPGPSATGQAGPG